MDGAAGNPPRSAPHESRSPPTANLRSGRFMRAQARWVAAGVPWSKVRCRSPSSVIMRDKKKARSPGSIRVRGARPSAGADGSLLKPNTRVRRLPNFGAAPLRPKPDGDAGERDVRPWASNVQLQIFTGLLPAAGGSLPEESPAGFGKIAAGVTWSKVRRRSPK